MQGLLPPSFMSPISKVSQGPWFKEYFATDDGLEYYYQFKDQNGETKYLLTNNLPWQDRENLWNLYQGCQRSKTFSLFFGHWAGLELVTRVPALKRLAFGWKFLAWALLGSFSTNVLITVGQSNYYRPLLSAYFKKYERFAKADLFEIRDEKREWFEIDDSQYMNYTNEDLSHDYHVNHGPQPDGEVLNNSWLVEMDKHLKGEV